MKIPSCVLTTVLTVATASAASPDDRAQAERLVSSMTLEEKASLFSGRDTWTTKPIDRLGVPSIVLTDGPHGVRRSSGSNFTDNLPATCFPTAPGLAATWNVPLLEEVGRALGQESQALNVQVLLGPGANMKRSPLGGRNFEYFSEDPVLSGRLAAAWIRGVQSQGVGTSLKHFAANNQETERLISDSLVPERALHEIYLASFELAVKEGKPETIMSSYNKLNGTYTTQNRSLLTDILRGKWGYEGIVVSDWGAVDDRVAALQAGLDLEMPASRGLNDQKIVAAVQAGQLPLAVVDRHATELVELALRTSRSKVAGATLPAAEHHALARRVAGEAIVLLKNEGLLPLAAEGKEKIAVIGAFAKEPRYQGSGSSRVTPTRLDDAFVELGALVGAQRLSYAPAYDAEGVVSDALQTEALDVAAKADRAIVLVGLPDSYESESFDRKNMDLPPDHNRLVEAILARQPNTVVVLMNGSAVALPWADRAKAIVECYLGGQAVGGALADVLTGKVNPSGKLAETFPRRLEDTPTYPNFPARGGKAYYGEGLFIGYRHYDAKKVEPLFPFGHGLSYTTFAYTAINLPSDQVKAAQGTVVEVKVKNTGARAGAEVVQLYVRPKQAEVLRPEKELKHFAKVMLAPGEEKTVRFTLNARDFAYFDDRASDWVVDSGAYDLLVGGSSRQLPLVKTLQVEGLPRPAYKLTRYSSLADLAAHPKGRAIYDDMIAGIMQGMGSATHEKSTPEEIKRAKKARETIEMFIREQTLGKMVMLSGGAFSEQALEEILKTTNE